MLETLEALTAERGDDEKIWGSMIKQTLKRRKPGFNESYYGFKSFSALLEVAFEVAFAGTVVRRLGRTEMIGSWARALLVGTWVHALVALVVLVATAAVLQRAVPDARTFAAAVKAIASR